MYHVANVFFWLSIIGCIVFGFYLFLNAPDPWATTASRLRMAMTVGLIASIAMLFISGAVSYGTKKVTAIQNAESQLAKIYAVPKANIALGDAVCTVAGRYSCETWLVGYVILKGTKTLTGFVRCDPYGAQDLQHQLLE